METRIATAGKEHPCETPTPRLHHVGYVVSSIEDVIKGFATSLSATWDGRVIHDPLQQVYVAFLESGTSTDAIVELVAPAGEVSPVTNFLSKGGGLHHLCYEVDNLEAHLQLAKAHGGIVVKSPLPAVAFGGRRIAWVYTKYKLLLEYVERNPG